MILLTLHEPAFTQLIIDDIPRIARIPQVRKLMKKFTSGFLTDQRLTDAIKLGTLPLISLEKFTPPDAGAFGNQQSDLIRIDSTDFEGYKEGHYTYRLIIPITVFHELAHWGYWKGQKMGHRSDTFGRSHHNHGDFLSPLDDELEKLFKLIVFFSGP